MTLFYISESIGAMSDLKLKAQEDKDGEIVSDSPGRIQEPLQSHTFSPKNNAAGLSSDEHENPLNGTQPNPFVYSSVPAVPHAGNSLPSGALVNGPGSHPTSEVHCVLNKGTVLSNNVLDAAWQAEKDTSLEVLRPPSGLQSDAWKNTAGPAAKTPATQPGVNAPLSHSEENESKLASSTLSGDGAERLRLGRPPRKRTIKTGSQRGAEWSGSASRRRRDAEAVGWDAASEGGPETEGMHRRDNAHAENTPGRLGKVKSNLNHINALFCSGNDDETVDTKANKDDEQADAKHRLALYQHLSRNNTLDSELGPEVERPLFFSCTICHVRFKERRHFHRHMMHHLGKRNQVNGSAPRPFTCRECGRLFCDSYSLTKHIIIHQDRPEHRRQALFVQPAKTHDNLKHYYFCEECNYITLTREALEAHFRVAHLDTRRPRAGDAEAGGRRADVGSFAGADSLVPGRPPLRGGSRTSPDQRQRPGLEPAPSLEKAASFPIGCGDNGVTRIPGVQTVDSSEFSCHVGGANSSALPSVWKIDEHRELLLQPAEKLKVATDLTCVEGDAGKSGRGAFGSPHRAATTDFLLSARNLKLDQMFCRGSENDPASQSLQVQANQRSPSMSTKPTPRRNTIDSVNANILPKHRQRLEKQPALRELERGYGGSSNFSEDSSEATGSFLESSKNERTHSARGCYRGSQRFSGKDQSPPVLKDEDGGDEDCSDIEQLVIKEEYMEGTVCGDSPGPPGASPRDTSDVLAARAAERKPCPYCPAVFKSGVGLSNHVRGHLHRVGLSYNARHVVSPEQVALGDRRRPRTRRSVSGARNVRKGTLTYLFPSQSQGRHGRRLHLGPNRCSIVCVQRCSSFR